MLNFHNFTETNNTIFCIKNTDGRVLYQNKPCLNLCGNMTDDPNPCNKNCMLRYVRDKECPDREEGTQYFSSQNIENHYYDIFFVNDKKYLTSILYPLDLKYKTDLKYFSQYTLTPRELEVVSLVVKKQTNKEICENLKLTRGTLKTHLNRIYKKLPPEACTKLRDNYNYLNSAPNNPE